MRLVDAIKMLEAFKAIAGDGAEVMVDVFQLEARVSDQVFDFVRNREREERPLTYTVHARVMQTTPAPEYAPGPQPGCSCVSCMNIGTGLKSDPRR